MRIRTGVRFDEFGHPVAPLYRDEEPGVARTSALNGTPQYRGVLVVALSTAHEERLAQRAYKARNPERQRELKRASRARRKAA